MTKKGTIVDTALSNNEVALLLKEAVEQLDNEEENKTGPEESRAKYEVPQLAGDSLTLRIGLFTWTITVERKEGPWPLEG